MYTKLLSLFLLVLFNVDQGLADTNKNILFNRLLSHQINLGMTHEAFNQLNLVTDEIPGTRNSPNALVFLKTSNGINNRSLLFVEGQLAAITCFWQQTNDAISDFKRVKEDEIISLGKKTKIEIGKRTKMHDTVRLDAQRIHLKNGEKLLVQANEIEISIMLFNEFLMKGKAAYFTFEELAKQPAYKNQFLKDVQLSPNKPLNGQVIMVNDYMKDEFKSFIPQRELETQVLFKDSMKKEGEKSGAFIESPNSILSQWLLFSSLAGGILWWTLKNRRKKLGTD